jgi:SAM-dependent methyltransferase
MWHGSGMDDYRVVNAASWDDRAPAHAASPDYAVERFLGDPTYLSHVVDFDRPLLGDIAGLEAVHLQCHIGTDTLSLARLGAQMTGLDFSAASLAEARRITAACGTPIDFVESDVYAAPAALGHRTFDLVYTGVGALCWLPDVRGWAAVVAQLLRPGGRLFIREGHPMLWALDELQEGLVVDYPYFERPEPLIDDDAGTYVETDRTFTQNVTHSWNHGLGEIVTALHEAGMQLTALVEHETVPWDALPGRMDRLENGEFRLSERPWRLAASYTLQAVRAR